MARELSMQEICGRTLLDESYEPFCPAICSWVIAAGRSGMYMHGLYQLHHSLGKIGSLNSLRYVVLKSVFLSLPPSKPEIGITEAEIYNLIQFTKQCLGTMSTVLVLG